MIWGAQSRADPGGPRAGQALPVLPKSVCSGPADKVGNPLHPLEQSVK